MPIQQVSFQNNVIAKQNQQHNVGVSSVATSSAGDTVEISSKKKENKALKYTLVGVGALLGIVAIAKHKSIAKLFEKSSEFIPENTNITKDASKETKASSQASNSHSSTFIHTTSNNNSVSNKSINNKLKTTATEPTKVAEAKIPTIGQATEEVKVSTPIKIVNSYLLEAVFKDLHEFKGDNIEFAKTTYNALRKHYGYEGILDDLVLFADKNDSGTAYFSAADCHFKLNTADDFNESKADIIDTIGHEFEHFFQYERIFCSEDIGIKKFSEALSEAYSQKFKNYQYQKYNPSFDSAIPPHKMDVNFIQNSLLQSWGRIIEKKGRIKSGTKETNDALVEFKDAISNKWKKTDFIKDDVTASPNIPDAFPEFSGMYDSFHSNWNYYYNPNEVKAREAGASLSKKFLGYQSKIEGKKVEIKEKSGFVKNIAEPTNEYINTLRKVYKSNNLPQEFLKYIYGDLCMDVYAISQAEDIEICSMNILHNIAKQISSSDEVYIKQKLRTFKQLVEEDKIRLEAPKAKEEFLAYTDNFLNN